MKKDDAEKEIKNYDIMQKIDEMYEYHLPMDKCEIAEKYKNLESTCKIPLDIEQSLQKQTTLLIMPYAGIHLEDFAEKNANTDNMNMFWVQFRRILYGLAKISDAGYAHCDIKHQNIMYNEKQMRINLIDFDMLSKLDEVKNVVTKYMAWYPFESHFFNQLYFEELKQLQNINEQTLTSNITPSEFKFRYFTSYLLDDENYLVKNKIFDKHTIQKYRKAIVENITEISKMKYEDFIQESVKTVDSFGAGITMAIVLQNTREFIDKDMEKQLDDLIWKMTNPMISERISIQESLIEYSLIINKNENEHVMKYLFNYIIKYNEHFFIKNRNDCVTHSGSTYINAKKHPPNTGNIFKSAEQIYNKIQKSTYSIYNKIFQLANSNEKNQKDTFNKMLEQIYIDYSLQNCRIDDRITRSLRITESSCIACIELFKQKFFETTDELIMTYYCILINHEMDKHIIEKNTMINSDYYIKIKKYVFDKLEENKEYGKLLPESKKLILLHDDYNVHENSIIIDQHYLKLIEEREKRIKNEKGGKIKKRINKSVRKTKHKNPKAKRRTIKISRLYR